MDPSTQCELASQRLRSCGRFDFGSQIHHILQVSSRPVKALATFDVQENLFPTGRTSPTLLAAKLGTTYRKLRRRTLPSIQIHHPVKVEATLLDWRHLLVLARVCHLRLPMVLGSRRRGVRAVRRWVLRVRRRVLATLLAFVRLTTVVRVLVVRARVHQRLQQAALLDLWHLLVLAGVRHLRLPVVLGRRAGTVGTVRRRVLRVRGRILATLLSLVALAALVTVFVVGTRVQPGP